jgi:hypothetical protein
MGNFHGELDSGASMMYVGAMNDDIVVVFHQEADGLEYLDQALIEENMIVVKEVLPYPDDDDKVIVMALENISDATGETEFVLAWDDLIPIWSMA